MKNLLFPLFFLIPLFVHSQNVTGGLEKVVQTGGTFVFPSVNDGEIRVQKIGQTYTIRWHKSEYYQLEYSGGEMTSFLKEQKGCKCLKAHSDSVLKRLLESKLDSIAKGQIGQPTPLLAETDATSLSLKALLEGSSLVERGGKVILRDEGVTVFVVRVANGELSSYDIVLYKGRPWQAGFYIDNMIPNAPTVPLTEEWLKKNLFN